MDRQQVKRSKTLYIYHRAKLQGNGGHVMNMTDRTNTVRLTTEYEPKHMMIFSAITNAGHEVNECFTLLTYQSQKQEENSESIRFKLGTYSSETQKEIT